MSSSAQLCVGGYPVYATQNYLDTWMFNVSDQRIFERPRKLRNPLIWTIDDDGDEIETAYEYQASVGRIKRRLELAGFSLEACKREFFEVRDELADHDNSWTEDPELKIHLDKVSKLIGDTSFEEWMKAVYAIMTDPRGLLHFKDEQDLSNDPPIYRVILGRDHLWNDDVFLLDLHIPARSFHSAMRLSLEMFDDDVVCTLDATELVGGGWTEAFELRETLGQKQTKFYDIFHTAVDSAIDLINLDHVNQVLLRLVYSNVITAMETYLADTAKKFILSHPPLLRRFVEKDKAFQGKKIALNHIFSTIETINEVVIEQLNSMSFHNVETISNVFCDVFLVKLPSDEMRELAQAVRFRHDIVHRNGRNFQGKEQIIKLYKVSNLGVMVCDLMKTIDDQIRDGLLETLNEDAV